MYRLCQESLESIWLSRKRVESLLNLEAIVSLHVFIKNLEQ
jgi:hypothetical protein